MYFIYPILYKHLIKIRTSHETIETFNDFEVIVTFDCPFMHDFLKLLSMNVITLFLNSFED